MDVCFPQDRFQAWLNLLQATAVVTAKAEEGLQRGCRISVPEHQVLLRLARARDRRLKMYDLAEQLFLSKSGVTRLVDRLERRHLVERELWPDDRRVILARITPQGEEMLGRATPILADKLQEVFSRHLDDREIAAMLASLRKILVANDAWGDPRCCPALTDAGLGEATG